MTLCGATAASKLFCTSSRFDRQAGRVKDEGEDVRGVRGDLTLAHPPDEGEEP